MGWGWVGWNQDVGTSLWARRVLCKIVATDVQGHTPPPHRPGAVEGHKGALGFNGLLVFLI